MVRVNPAFDAGVGATIVELTNAGTPVYWATIAGEMPAQLTCSTSADKSNCVLVASVGAHGSNAAVWRLGGATLHRGSTVASDSPNMRALDLNGDGWVDAEGLQNTYNPDYASGAVYWQTWISDGTHLTSTGCTPPTHSQPGAPAAPVTGTCAH
jgi:hypothetical protein